MRPPEYGIACGIHVENEFFYFQWDKEKRRILAQNLKFVAVENNPRFTLHKTKPITKMRLSRSAMIPTLSLLAAMPGVAANGSVRLLYCRPSLLFVCSPCMLFLESSLSLLLLSLHWSDHVRSSVVHQPYRTDYAVVLTTMEAYLELILLAAWRRK
jgi:hypothetical protein